MNHNSHALYKHHTKMTLQAMSDEERTEYVKRFTTQELDEIIGYDLSYDPHLYRFIKHKKPISY